MIVPEGRAYEVVPGGKTFLQSIALIRAGKLKMVYYGRYVIAYS